MEIPYHLAGNKAKGEKDDHCIAQYEIGDYQNFVYLILDWKSRKAAIIDPQKDLTLPLGCLKKYGFELVAIFLTHTHFDHVAGLPQLVKDYSKTPIYVHANDLHRLNESVLRSGKIQEAKEGDLISIGQIPVQILHTPGHSAGECSYLVTQELPYLFTGDTVFIQDCGRTDLPTGSTEEMFHTLQRIRALPPETVILPGHHYRQECASLLGKELSSSPPFQCKTVDELAALP